MSDHVTPSVHDRTDDLSKIITSMPKVLAWMPLLEGPAYEPS